MPICIECDYARVLPAAIGASGTQLPCSSLRHPADHTVTYNGPTFIPEPDERDYLCFYGVDEDFLHRKPVTGQIDLDDIKRCYERNGLGDCEEFKERGSEQDEEGDGQ